MPRWSFWRRPGFVVSLFIHLAGIVALSIHPEPELIAPSPLMKGKNGAAATEIYLSNAALRSAIEPAVEPAPTLPKKSVRSIKPAPPKPQTTIKGPEFLARNEDVKQGSEVGSVAYGFAYGHDVRPALPEVFPDPPVVREELPVGFEGDVVVEVTIDSNGIVIKTKLLQGINPAIEQKVIATVQHWRFKPATRDGSPIPSRQDVHFHYPS